MHRSSASVRLWGVLILVACLSCSQEQGSTDLERVLGDEGVACPRITSALHARTDEFILSLEASCTTDEECTSALISIVRGSTRCLAGCSIAVAASSVDRLSEFLTSDREVTRLCEEFAEASCLTDVPGCLAGVPRCIGGFCQLGDPEPQ